MHAINPDLDAQVLDSLRKIGANVRRARKEAFRESREAFARRLGCAPMTLDRIENGEPGVAVIYLFAALQAMHVLRDVEKATSPQLLIATLIPAEFPANFDVPKTD
jgi:hypothetical protein